MKVHELSHGRARTLTVQAVRALSRPSGLAMLEEVDLIFSEDAACWLLCRGDTRIEITGADERSRADLRAMQRSTSPPLAWIVQSQETDIFQATLETREFPAVQNWPGGIDIGVDDQLVDDLRRRQGKQLSVEDVCRYLSDQFIIHAAKARYCVLADSPVRELRDAPAFRVHGQAVVVDVRRTDDSRLRATRVVQARSALEPSEERPLLLIEAQFAFVDATLAGEVRGAAAAELDEIVRSTDSYLRLWGQYNRIERGNVLARAREFGWLKYTECKPLGSLWRFWLAADNDLTQRLHMLSEGEEAILEADVGPPIELSNPSAGDAPDLGFGSRPQVFAGQCVSWSPEGYLDLQQADMRMAIAPPSSGVLFLSWSGDRVRLKRRDDALMSVMSTACPMPQLGLLLENRPVRTRHQRKVEPLSAKTREVLGGDPTDRQREALEIALNTPDLALIQGPPGTGKTRVIAALQTRLSEFKEGTSVVSRALLTSYQHDAVENVANATSVYGLPAVRVGGRRREDGRSDGFERWRLEAAEAVRARLADFPQSPQSRRAQTVRSLFRSYLDSPCVGTMLADLLRDVLDAGVGSLSAETIQAITSLIHMAADSQLSAGAGMREDAVIKSVRGIRTDPIGFSDDGPQQVARALERLRDRAALDEETLRTLESAALWTEASVPPFIRDLAAARDRLLDALQSGPNEVGAARINVDVEQALKRALDEVTGYASLTPRSESDVLYQFLDDLELNPKGVREAVQEYSVVLAATCQQAMGYQMRQARQVEGAGQIIFDTVVVDEAARANPLDLLIPMSQAERRIVLVGDHRQLPHLLDQQIEREVDQNVSDATRTALRQSLFETLFTQLRAREAKDGVRRTVTLDKQFRMNPTLASFVSRTFYEPYGEGFDSDPSAEQWTPTVPGWEGYVAGWVDLPFDKGAERAGRSKSRPVEARWIAEEASRILEADSRLSVGVISFYSAQVAELMREFEKRGITERLENGLFSVAERWQLTTDAQGRVVERFRVGTVDAFQGKEFDVVLLSATRSNPIVPETEGSCRKKYGHLMLENRLCVAMSRQRRLLLTVGDASMFSNDAARQHVPGLAAFLKLCEGNDGVVVRP